MEHLLNNKPNSNEDHEDDIKQGSSTTAAETTGTSRTSASSRLDGRERRVPKSEHADPYTRSPPAMLSAAYSRSPYSVPATATTAHIPEHSYHHYHRHQQQQQQTSSRLLPGYSPNRTPMSHLQPANPVIHSPIAGMSTPRLPPISMLTAAASLQPRMRRQASSQVSTQQPPMHPDDQDNLCRYRNKRCGNARAIKRNGDRHNLCEKHRAKANQNQRKLESKRRTQKKTISRTQHQHLLSHADQIPDHIHPQGGLGQHQHVRQQGQVVASLAQPPPYTLYRGMYVQPPSSEQGLSC